MLFPEPFRDHKMTMNKLSVGFAELEIVPEQSAATTFFPKAHKEAQGHSASPCSQMGSNGKDKEGPVAWPRRDRDSGSGQGDSKAMGWCWKSPQQLSPLQPWATPFFERSTKRQVHLHSTWGVCVARHLAKSTSRKRQWMNYLLYTSKQVYGYMLNMFANETRNSQGYILKSNGFVVPLWFG